MKEITVGICEDNPADCEQLLQYLKRAADELNLSFIIRTFESGREFLDHCSMDYDLIFLDVELPDMSGDNVAAKIRQYDERVYLVFISRHVNYISIGYKHEARNYLLKPLKYFHIRDEIGRFLKSTSAFQQEYLWISDKHNTKKILFSKLRYIETENRAVILHYENNVFRHPCGITSFMKKLPEHIFFRCNHSYIVNLQFVDCIIPDINRFSIHLVTGEMIPLSRDRKKDFLLELQKAGEHLC